MTRAAIYVRISDDREGKALGVERQEADCRTLAERLGLTVVAVYCDNDISASTRTRAVRPGYRRLLADAAGREFEVVLAATSARITRKPREFEDLIELAELHRTRFEYDKSPRFDLNTADGRMMARMMAAADAAEAERISERVTRKLAERAAAGKPHGGQRPYGWEMDRTTVREPEAAHLRWAVEHLLGGLSMMSVVRGLNERGARNTRGREWRHATLRKVLMNPRHAGLMPDGSPATWPAIVTLEQHRALLRLLNDPARVTTPGRAGKLHLLSGGIATCDVGGCGEPLRVGVSRGRRTPDYHVYRCRAAHVVRNKEHVERFVRDVIAARLRRPDAVRLLAAAEDEAGRAARAEAEATAETLRQRLDEAAEAFARGAITGRQLETVSSSLRGELADAETAAAPPPDRAAAFGDILGADDRGAAFLAAGVARQRAVIALLIRVRVGRGVRGNTFRPDGIEIDWR